jgi:hypothetical protein
MNIIFSAAMLSITVTLTVVRGTVSVMLTVDCQCGNVRVDSRNVEVRPTQDSASRTGGRTHGHGHTVTGSRDIYCSNAS